MSQFLPAPIPISILPGGQAPPSLATISGPLFLGGGFNVLLFGVLSVQVYLYFLAFRNDGAAIQSIVYSVFALEALQSTLIVRDMYDTFVFGGMVLQDTNQLVKVHTLWLSVPVLTGLGEYDLMLARLLGSYSICAAVTFICQGLFAYRIWILATGRKPLRIAFYLISVSCLIELVSSLILAVALKKIGDFDLAANTDSFTFMTGIWYCSSSFGDILIAGCMTFLARETNANISRHTRTFLHRVVRLTVGTASATAVIAIVTLILTVVGPIYPSYYQASVAVLGKMYSNSMMVMLNNRLVITSSYHGRKWTLQTTNATSTFALSELRFGHDTTAAGRTST